MFEAEKKYALANAQAKQKGLKNEHSFVRPLEIQLGFFSNGNEGSVVVLRYSLLYKIPNNQL